MVSTEYTLTEERVNGLLILSVYIYENPSIQATKLFTVLLGLEESEREEEMNIREVMLSLSGFEIEKQQTPFKKPKGLSAKRDHAKFIAGELCIEEALSFLFPEVPSTP